jgi:S13-like protein
MAYMQKEPQQEQAKPAKEKVPERTRQQRMDALKRANEVRTKRAQLKRDLKAQRKSIYDVLLEPPEWAKTMKVFDLMLACPKYGRVKVNKVLQACRVSPSKTVGGMSQRQRIAMILMVRQ